MYLDRATLLEYTIEIIIIIIIVTRTLLRYARLIYAQRPLALTLLILVLIHTTLNN